MLSFPEIITEKKVLLYQRGCQLILSYCCDWITQKSASKDRVNEGVKGEYICRKEVGNDTWTLLYLHFTCNAGQRLDGSRSLEEQYPLDSVKPYILNLMLARLLTAHYIYHNYSW